LLKFSVGLNLGLHFLSGAITFDPLVTEVDPLIASKVVVLDSLISNIDRTAKNTNLLNWHKELWIIDNGASFYFHHDWKNWENHLARTFPLIKEHVLLSQATKLSEAATEISAIFTKDKITEIISNIPEDWLLSESDTMRPDEMRAAYVAFINAKLSMVDVLVKEAKDAK